MEENKNTLVEELKKDEKLEFTDFGSSKNITNLLKGLLEFHKLMEEETIVTDAKNPFYRSDYLTLGGLLDAVLPKLNKAGIVIMQMPMEREGNIYVNTRIYHAESGEFFNYNCVGVKKGKTSQDIIGDSTYLKRASLSSALMICAKSEDDDGNQNKTRNTSEQPAPQSNTTEQPTPTRRRRV